MNQPLSPALFARFDALSCRLSPENLTCDGECSPAEVRQRFAAIRREWAALEKEAGRKVTETEIEAAIYAKWDAEDARRFSTSLTDEQREAEARVNA